MSESTHVLLLTGSNLGVRSDQLARCRRLIGLLMGALTDASPIYKTAAWGKEDQPAFLNQALTIRTNYSPEGLLQRIGEIEQKLGRVRKEKWAARTIDIDILLFGEKIVQTPSLQIPHPEMENRKFALLPAAQIAGEWLHPGSRKSVNQLLMECADPLAAEAVKLP